MSSDAGLGIAIVYGSTYGRAEDAAERIAAELGTLLGTPPTLIEIGSADLNDLAKHDVLILGCSTWNGGELQADWDYRLPEFRELDLTGKLVALFGAGDSFAYTESFQDALGILADVCEERGARLVGAWPTDGYDFEASLALRDGLFVGLALDYDNQEHLNAERIAAWCARLVTELVLPRIVGFDRDEEGHWVALLSCGHRQHVRHDPPLVEREWVLTEAGRAGRLGVVLRCVRCERGEPVGPVSPISSADSLDDAEVGLEVAEAPPQVLDRRF